MNDAMKHSWRLASMLLLLAAVACAQEVEFERPLPIADAGDDQLRLLAGDSLFIGLEGRASCDPSGDLIEAYHWSLTGKPAGSQAILNDADTIHPNFEADKVGAYFVALIVEAHGETSDPDEIIIELRDDLERDIAPVAPTHNRCNDQLF